MIRRLCFALPIAVALSAASAAQAQPAVPPPPPGSFANAGDVDESVFYEPLAAYGEWNEIAPYGWCWTPHNVDVDWRPYQVGRWVWTDAGWTWVSDEPFGWATYHYGRWNYNPQFGWIWIPGTQWAPAWVQWREGDGWVGWAPLPWDQNSRSGLSLNVGNFHVNIGKVHRFGWCFVEENHMCDSSLRPYIVRQPRNASIYDLTRDVTNYSIGNNIIINRSIDIRAIEKRIGHAVPRFALHEEHGPITRTMINNNAISIYRPKFANRRPTRTPVTVLGKRNVIIKPDTRRWEEDRKRLDTHMASERAALLERQRRELAAKGADRRALEKRHAAEQAALKEQADRDRKLLERSHDRVSKGHVGATRSVDPKFRVPEPPKPQPPVQPPPQEKPKRRR